MTSQPTTDTPLHSLAAERALLGCLLRDNRCLESVRALIPDEARFYAFAHQILWRAIVTLTSAGRPADLVSVYEWLRGQDLLDELGAAPGAYLGQLLSATATTAHAPHYARLVREQYLRRALVHVCNDVIEACHSQTGPVEELLEKARAAVVSVLAAAGLPPREERP